MRKLTVGVLLGVFCAIIGRPEESAVRRMAVLALGDEAPNSVVALLEARLLEKERQVVVLERSQVDRLLNEQTLGLIKADQVDSQSAVQTGKLWGVDVFCLLSRSEKTLRIQMVDTWYGIRMLDILLPFPGKKDLENTTDMIIGRILQRLPAVTPAPEGLRMIGILDIKSMEPTRRLDDLTRPVRAAIEQQAMHQPDLIVAEREQVRPLMEERELVDEFPERIRSSVVLVDGEFHLDTEDPNQLRLFLQGRRNGTRVFRLEVKGPLHDLNLIGNRAAKAIAEAMGTVDSIGEMDPKLEADMLVAQSKATRDASSALGAVAAAKALMPNEEEYELEWLDAHYRWRSKHPISPESFQSYINSCKGIILSHLDDPSLNVDKGLATPLSLLHKCSVILESAENFSPVDRDRMRRQLMALLEKCWERFVSTSLKIPKSINSRQESFYSILKRIQPVDKDEAFLFYAEISMTASIRLLLNISNEVVWPGELSAEERFRQNYLFYSWMASRERPEMRLAGKRGLARIHVHPESEGGYEQARAYYEEFEHEFLYVYLPNAGHDPRNSVLHEEAYPYWIKAFLDSTGFDREAGPSRYFEDPEESLRYRADHIEILLRRVLTDPASPQRVDWAWFGNLLEPLGQAGRHRIQAELNELILDYCKRGLDLFEGRKEDPHRRQMGGRISNYEKHLHRLREQHPELLAFPDGRRQAFEARKLFCLIEDTADLVADSSQLYGNRLVLEHGMAAVLCGNGVLFLDPDSLQPRRFQSAPDGIRIEKWYAADETGIYTVSRDGIAFFPKTGGAAKGFFKDHPDLSGGYHDIDILDRRIYLLTSQSLTVSGRSTLEFDLNRGTRKILMSVKSGVRDPAMRGLRSILYVMSEPEKKRLHFCVRKKVNGEHSVDSYSYDPDTETFTPSGELNLFYYKTGSVRRRGSEITNIGSFGVEFKDMSKDFTSLTRVESYDHRFDGYGPITRVGKGMLGIEHFRSELNYFPSPDSDVLKIKYDVFPSEKGKAPRLVDLATHPEQGVLILASDALYAVPTLTHSPEAESISGTKLDAEETK